VLIAVLILTHFAAAAKELSSTQVKLDYGLPESASARGAPDTERLLVVCSPAARAALLTAAGVADVSSVAAASEPAQNASAETAIVCVSISGGLFKIVVPRQPAVVPVPMRLRMWTCVVNT